MTKEDEMIVELQKIVTLLTPKPTPSPTAPDSFIGEFKYFLTKYKVLGLAVAFILGVYLGQLVQALVNDLIMPLLGMLLPENESWQVYTIGPFLIGHFVGQVIIFIIVALVIFILVKYSKRLGIQ